MKKLHELLSIEPDLRTEAQKIGSDVRTTLADPRLVTGLIRTYRPLVEDEDTEPEERTEMITTAPAELDRFNEVMGQFIDSALTKELTNTEAMSKLQLAGQVWELPSTALLNLENRLGEIRKVYAAIPTLDPAEIWHYDDDLEVYVSNVRTTFKTRKVPKTLVAVEATKEHPAQVQIYNADERVGEKETILHSGAMTVARKRLLLRRIDNLTKEVKQARQRGNDIEVKEVNLSSDLFKVINA